MKGGRCLFLKNGTAVSKRRTEWTQNADYSLMNLSGVIAALSLACNVIRAVVDLIRYRQDKKRAATTPNSDGSGAEKHQ